MRRKIVEFAAILGVAALIYWAVFWILAGYAHSVGAIAGWFITLTSLILMPPVALSFVADRLSPMMFQVAVYLLEVIYVYMVWFLLKKWLNRAA